MSVKLIGYSVFCPGGDEEFFVADEESLQSFESLVCGICSNYLRIEGITKYND